MFFFGQTASWSATATGPEREKLMEPKPSVTPWAQKGPMPYSSQPSSPGYYYAAPVAGPASPSTTTLVNQPRSTWLGRWGLGCSILGLILPIIAAWAQSGLLLVVAVVFPILGVVFSSVAMSRRYTRRGLGIAGLVVGIVALAPVLIGVVVFVIGGLNS